MVEIFLILSGPYLVVSVICRLPMGDQISLLQGSSNKISRFRRLRGMETTPLGSPKCSVFDLELIVNPDNISILIIRKCAIDILPPGFPVLMADL